MTDADAVLSGCWEFGAKGPPLAWAGKRNPNGPRLLRPWGEVSHADGCDVFIGQVNFFCSDFFPANFSGKCKKERYTVG